ncbi:HDOD domain-containing protein [Desulfovibrionales bacterium]
MQKHPTPPANLHLLARTPIFTAGKTIWGYEIQTTTELDARSQAVPEQANVGAAIIAGDYVGLRSILARNKKLVLFYTLTQLTSQMPHALPAALSAILVPATLQDQPSLVDALQDLAANGHTIVLEWQPGITAHTPALEYASHLYLATLPHAADPDWAQTMHGRICIARAVNTKAEFEAAQACGCTLFQGRYFKTAEIIPGKTLSTHQNSRLHIMRSIEAPDPDLDQLAQTIQSDVSLSYRLLTYLNSPSFGFARKVESIRQALTLLGWNNLRRWLRAILLADISQGEHQTELMLFALRRAKFLEQVIQAYDYWGFNPDELFLLGMFSLLDAILGIPMTEVISYLPLTDGQKKALLGDATCEYAPLMRLLVAFEDDDHAVRTKALLDLSLNQQQVESMYYEASAWAVAVLEPVQTTAA